MVICKPTTCVQIDPSNLDQATGRPVELDSHPGADAFPGSFGLKFATVRMATAATLQALPLTFQNDCLRVKCHDPRRPLSGKRRPKSSHVFTIFSTMCLLEKIQRDKCVIDAFKLIPLGGGGGRPF